MCCFKLKWTRAVFILLVLPTLIVFHGEIFFLKYGQFLCCFTGRFYSTAWWKHEGIITADGVSIDA